MNDHDDDRWKRVVIPFRLPKAQYDELIGKHEHRLREHKHSLRECAPHATRLANMLQAGDIDLQAFVCEALQAIAELEISVHFLELNAEDHHEPGD